MNFDSRFFQKKRITERQKLFFTLVIIPILFVPVIVLISIEDVEAKDYTGNEVLKRSVWFKVATNHTVSVEYADCFDQGGSMYGCGMQPTNANEFRVFQFRTESNVEAPYNATILYADEQKSVWTLQYNASSPSDPRLLVNGTVLSGIALNNQNFTEGGSIWNYLGGAQANQIELNAQGQTADNFTVYYPQNNNTEFATLGRSIEGNYLNNFTKIIKEKILGWYEHYNPTPERADKLIDLLENDQDTLYRIILKKLLNQFDDSQADDVKKYGKQLLLAYKEKFTIPEIVEKIENKVRNDTGDSFGSGDNPNIGVEPPAT